MLHKTARIGLIVILVLSILPAGCKSDKKKKALAEAAQAKAEAVKLRADIVELKGQISYLKDKLQTAELAKDKLRKQSEELIEDTEASTTDVQDAQQEIDNLKAQLAEQTKKANDLQKQVDQLKAIIREFQARIEPNKPPEPAKTMQEPNNN